MNKGKNGVSIPNVYMTSQLINMKNATKPVFKIKRVLLFTEKPVSYYQMFFLEITSSC